MTKWVADAYTKLARPTACQSTPRAFRRCGIQVQIDASEDQEIEFRGLKNYKVYGNSVVVDRLDSLLGAEEVGTICQYEEEEEEDDMHGIRKWRSNGPVGVAQGRSCMGGGKRIKCVPRHAFVWMEKKTSTPYFCLKWTNSFSFLSTFTSPSLDIRATQQHNKHFRTTCRCKPPR